MAGRVPMREKEMDREVSEAGGEIENSDAYA